MKYFFVIFLLIIFNLFTGCNAKDKENNDRADKFWQRALVEVYKSSEELQAQDEREKRKGQVSRKLVRGNPDIKAVALTFDDGPHPDYTPKLLEVLKKYNIKATFFVIGKMAEKHPELIKAEIKDGHLLGNHTFHHVNLTKIPEDEVQVEWQACNDVIKFITGINMGFCRPPGGDYDSCVINGAVNTGLTTVLWTDDPGDYARPGDKVIEDRIFKWINPGGIILLHDGVQQTIDVLPDIIEKLQKEGYKFVTVDEMEKELKK